MMHKSGLIVLSSIMLVTLGLGGCDKQKSPVQTETEGEVSSSGTKTENDLYIEKLNQDVKVENPDALLDEVNKDTSGK
jgi:hypothetical protein